VPEGVDYAPPPAGYALVGLQYHADLQVGNTPLQVGLSIHNLFNTRYRDYLSRWRYYIDEPGRTLVVRVRIPFGTAASGG
jgi:iron complex outermembrane receptor protein